MKFVDITGKKFGRILVLSLHSKGKRTYWNCVCDCGKQKIINGQHLKSGKIVSCGCYSIERHVGKKKSNQNGFFQDGTYLCHSLQGAISKFSRSKR